MYCPAGGGGRGAGKTPLHTFAHVLSHRLDSIFCMAVFNSNLSIISLIDRAFVVFKKSSHIQTHPDFLLHYLIGLSVF